MPTWIADRTFSGSAKRVSAVLAPNRPDFASSSRLERRAEIKAISYMAKMPFIKSNRVMTSISKISTPKNSFNLFAHFHIPGQIITHSHHRFLSRIFSGNWLIAFRNDSREADNVSNSCAWIKGMALIPLLSIASITYWIVSLSGSSAG